MRIPSRITAPLHRLAIWSSCAALVLAADLITKAVPHRQMAANYAHTPLLVFAVVGLFLLSFVAWHSTALVVGAGLMFGALAGNAGQLIVAGYATDWIPIGGWLTNVADIAGAIGLMICFAGYARHFVHPADPEPVRLEADDS